MDGKTIGIVIAIVSVLASVIAILGFTVRSLFRALWKMIAMFSDHLDREEKVMQGLEKGIEALNKNLGGVQDQIDELHEDITPIQVPGSGPRASGPRSTGYAVFRRTPPSGVRIRRKKDE